MRVRETTYLKSAKKEVFFQVENKNLKESKKKK